jgi:hypothetical protein
MGQLPDAPNPEAHVIVEPIVGNAAHRTGMAAGRATMAALAREQEAT